MKTGLKRHISAWLLLAVFVPMLVLTALHTHAVASSVSDECVECVNHQPHSGHLTTTTQTLTDCVLCQFFSLQYLETAVATLAAPVGLAFLTCRTNTVTCPTRSQTLHASRAPPFC